MRLKRAGRDSAEGNLQVRSPFSSGNDYIHLDSLLLASGPSLGRKEIKDLREFPSWAVSPSFFIYLVGIGVGVTVLSTGSGSEDNVRTWFSPFYLCVGTGEGKLNSGHQAWCQVPWPLGVILPSPRAFLVPGIQELDSMH